MSISVLNEHKSLNGGEPTTTITYCINTDNLNDTNNNIIKSRGGDLTVPTIRQRTSSGSSTSSFKRLFRSSSKTNNKSIDNNNKSLSDRCSSIDNVLVNIQNNDKRDLSRTRSLKAPNQGKNNSNNKLTVNQQQGQQPVQRSESENRRHNTPQIIKRKMMNTSPETATTSSNNNFLKPNLAKSESGDISNGTLTPKRPSFIKRMSLKLRKSKSVKKTEQPNQQQQIEEHDVINLNLEVMRQVFEFFDSSKKGYITLDDVEITMKKLEHLKDEIEFPNKDKIRDSFNKYSKNGNLALDFHSFLDIMRNVETETIAENNNNEMRYYFKQFDRNGDGKIDKDELRLVMEKLFPNDDINEFDIERMLDEADLDQNGTIDFFEFVNLFSLFNSQFTAEQNITRELVNCSIKNCGLIVSKNNKKMQTIDLKQAFTMFDKNGDNKISPVELEEVMKYLGLNPSSDECKKMIKVVDKNCNGFVDYDEFISMMTQTKLKPRDENDELKEIFKVFDIDGNGFISADEIKIKMAQLGDDLTDEEVKEMIKSADTNGDGLIDIHEFSKLLQFAKGMK